MEGPNLYKSESREREPDPLLLELWERYEFPGKPPFKNSAVEKRLQDACREYRNEVDTLSSPNTYRAGDSENYVPESQRRIIGRASVSESRRRDLHNQIALLVVSKQRSGMDRTMAEHIASFALEYADGL